MMYNLYLDCNAHQPLNPKALKAYSDFVASSASHGHPSAPSVTGRKANVEYEKARGKIASLIGATKPGQIIFTSGCTQACEWAVQMMLHQAKGEEEYFVSPLEHTAIRDAVEYHEEACECGRVTRKLKVRPDATIEEKTCDGAICIHMQNEVGTIQPLDRIHAPKLLVDMSQSLGKVPINVTEMNVDIAVFGAHKFGGPTGFGFIYLKTPSWYVPFGTGSRYFLDRTGTPDVAGAVATSVALEDALETLDARRQKMTEFQTTLEGGLEEKGYKIIGKDAVRSPNTTFVNIPNKAMKALMDLGDKGIYAGLGSACGSIHTDKSPLLRALKLNGGIHDYIRFSQWGNYAAAEAKDVLKILEKAL